MKFGDLNSSRPRDMCNMFRAFFSSVFMPVSNTFCPVMEYSTPFVLNETSVTGEAIYNKLKALDTSKGCGPDFISPAVLKYCRDELAPILLHMFNLSLVKGDFPDILKEGYVVPIFKSGDTQDVTNYRPIVILSVLSKILEGLVLDILQPLFKNIIIDEQHGFMAGRSTITNLLIFQSYVLEVFKRRHQVDAVYIDFSKAFDRVSHNRLLNKLEGYGVVGTMLAWFRSYLSDRRLVVRFANQTSEVFVASSGVPQGSHLGPLLFSIFINDIKEVIKVPFLLFADDIKLFLEISSSADCEHLQQALNCVSEWCQCNEMSINVSKTKLITFKRTSSSIGFDYILDDKPLVRCTSIKDLGIVLDSFFGYSLHIDQICCRASRMMGLMMRTSRHGLSSSALLLLYKSLVLQLLEYGSVVWSPYQLGLIDRLQSVQRRFLGFLDWREPDGNVNMHQLHPLVVRREVADVTFLFKVLNSMVVCPPLLEQITFRLPSPTRSHRLFELGHLSRNYLQFSSVPRILRLGNEVCGEVDFFCDRLGALRRAVLSLRMETFVRD